MPIISRNSSELAVQQVGSIVSLLQKAVKIVCLYPSCNPSCAKAISLFKSELGSFLRSNEHLLLTLAEDGFIFENDNVEPTFGDSHRLSKMCYDAGVSELAFGQDFSDESAAEVFDIFRRVISKDEGDLELGEALWSKEIPGFSYEIIEDQSYLEFDSELRREFFNSQGARLESGHLSEDSSDLAVFSSTFDEQDDSNSLIKMTEEQSERFESIVTTLSDDTTEEETSEANQRDNSINPQDLLLRTYELDTRETHETSMALAKDSMFNANMELLGLLDDLLEQDTQIKDFGNTLLTFIKSHTYFIEQGAFKEATATLHKLQKRRSQLKELSPTWEAKIGEALSSVASRERMISVCRILNESDSVSSEDLSKYLATFDWTAYSTLIEILGQIERQEHRIALCEFLSGAKEEHVDLLASGLYDKRWFVARNTAMILSNFDCSRSHSHLLKAMRHTECRVRIEVVRGCQSHTGDFRSAILLEAISDEEPQIRVLGVEIALAVSGSDTFALFEKLLARLLAGKIPKSTAKQVIFGYSRSGQSQAVEKLAKLAGDWRLIGHSPYEFLRESSFGALQINDSLQAEKSLKTLSKSWCKDIKYKSLAALQARTNSREELSHEELSQGELPQKEQSP